MNARQRRYHQDVAEIIVAATGKTIDGIVATIENPKILQRILRLERQMMGGRPRGRMVNAIRKQLAKLKRLGLKTCPDCGCTDRHGCPGGCTWEGDQCSQCNIPF